MHTFLDAPAPMTAKCIIRDLLKRIRHAPSDSDAGRWAVEIISELRAEGYEIVARERPK